jgi:hypothetical protein
MAFQTFSKQWPSREARDGSFFMRMMQSAIIRFAKPFIQQDMAGADGLRRAFVEGDRRNPLWRSSHERIGRSTFHPYRMRLNLRNAVDRAAFFLGRWEQHETQLFMRDVLYTSDVVIDIGANRGMFTLCAAHLVGRSGLVVSFEPDSASRKLMEREISINNIRNVSVRPYGAAAREEKSGTAAEPFRVVRGDDHIRNLSPALIRIACKSGAHEALSGLTRTIKAGYPVMLVDLDAASDRDAVTKTLSELGYTGERLTVSGKGAKAKWSVAPMGDAATAFTSVWTHPATHSASRRIVDSRRTS